MVSVGDYGTIITNYTLAREEGNYPEILQVVDFALQFAVDTGWFAYAEDIMTVAKKSSGRGWILTISSPSSPTTTR